MKEQNVLLSRRVSRVRGALYAAEYYKELQQSGVPHAESCMLLLFGILRCGTCAHWHNAIEKRARANLRFGGELASLSDQILLLVVRMHRGRVLVAGRRRPARRHRQANPELE